jgi:hypothetical protein
MEAEFLGMIEEADLNINVFLYTMAGECIFLTLEAIPRT